MFNQSNRSPGPKTNHVTGLEINLEIDLATGPGISLLEGGVLRTPEGVANPAAGPARGPDQRVRVTTLGRRTGILNRTVCRYSAPLFGLGT